jgi:hypothetical protein
LLDGIWLSRAHAGRSELEQACEVGRTVLEWLPHVDSTELDCKLQLVA